MQFSSPTPLPPYLTHSLPYSFSPSLPRNRMNLHDTQTFYLIVNHKPIDSTSMTLLELYPTMKDDDGYLYMTYASQEVFG